MNSRVASRLRCLLPLVRGLWSRVAGRTRLPSTIAVSLAAAIALIFAALTFAALTSAAPTQESSAQTIEYRFREMGVEFRMLVCGSDRTRVENACEACRLRVTELNRIFSDYEADSEVCRLHAAIVDQPVQISPELYELVAQSLQLSQATGGAFDITVGPLSRLWRDARRRGEVPPAEANAVAKRSVGWRWLELVPPDRLVFRTSGMQLDFGGIGQGYAADACLKILAEAGFPSALVDASGDIAIGMAPPNRPEGWRIGVAADPDAQELTRFLKLSCCGVSTSGDDQQHLQRGADRLSHIFDPRTGEPLVNAPRLTVIAADATTADAYASALSVLSADEGMVLVEKTSGVSALWSFQRDESNGEPGQQSSSRFPKFVTTPDR